MNKVKKIFFLITFFLPLFVSAQTYYWIGFTDKLNSPFSIDNPSAYLSERAIQRRANQNIPIDIKDLPVNQYYINQILEKGAKFIHSSKWLNGITVKSDSVKFEDEIGKLGFVNNIQVSKRHLSTTKSLKCKFSEKGGLNDVVGIDTSYYGNSVFQVGQLNGHFLHNDNYLGQGKQIAVLDAGFLNVDEYSSFDSLWANGQILGMVDFVDPGSDFFAGHYHGMSVLSTMGGNIPGKLIGTAPKASYWLLRTEDAPTEFIIEEDNWVTAAEFADSVGADIINTSLGYTLFYDSLTNHSFADLDGNTTRVTKAANIAVSRGMLVFVSAGNEGYSSWRHIVAPSDGENVIAVGAVNKEGVPAAFTSHGPAADGSVKPNVAAIGWNTVLQKSDGAIGTSSGTSYSSPVMAGMAACLWQANNTATAKQIKSAIENSAHLFNSPDTLLGYGIPDFEIANQILKVSNISDTFEEKDWLIVPNPFNDRLALFRYDTSIDNKLLLQFYDMNGKIILQRNIISSPHVIINNLSGLPKGMILLRITSDNYSSNYKLIKSD